MSAEGEIEERARRQVLKRGMPPFLREEND